MLTLGLSFFVAINWLRGFVLQMRIGVPVRKPHQMFFKSFTSDHCGRAAAKFTIHFVNRLLIHRSIANEVRNLCSQKWAGNWFRLDVLRERIPYGISRAGDDLRGSDCEADLERIP